MHSFTKITFLIFKGELFVQFLRCTLCAAAGCDLANGPIGWARECHALLAPGKKGNWSWLFNSHTDPQPHSQTVTKAYSHTVTE